MPTLVYRTSGRKIKPNLTPAQKLIRSLQAAGMPPKQAAAEARWRELKMQLIKLNQ